jgi:hypothetical protein
MIRGAGGRATGVCLRGAALLSGQSVFSERTCMMLSNVLRRARLATCVLVGLCGLPAGTARAESDWDIYMLRLVNRARQDPAGEAARIGTTVTDTRAPVPPLAYHPNVASAARNHTDWMHANFGSIASISVPDSLSHYETLDGTAGGTPATGTPYYTGVTVGARLTAAGFAYSSWGENITARWSTLTIPVNQGRIEATHKGWWESSGHRNNMLSGTYTVLGFRADSRAFTPPRGGLTAPIDNLHFATQVYTRPSGSPYTYIFGLLYDDLDDDGAWTPREANDPLREGLAGVPFDVYTAGTSSRVTGGTTSEAGAFTVRVGNGVYDIAFHVGSGVVMVESVAVSGANVNAGDIVATSTPDPVRQLVDCWAGPSVTPSPTLAGLTPQDCLELFDGDADGDVDLYDYATYSAAD